MLLLPILLTILAALLPATLAAFGYTTSGNNLIVDAGASNPLVFTVSRSSCDITSIRFRNVELQGDPKGSHIGSGLGSASVNAQQIQGSSRRYIKVTCDAGSLTQYLIVVEGDSTIYMATHITAQPSIGELRFIARLNANVLPFEHPFGAVSTTARSSSTVEGSDVFIVNGQTRSKFYSSERFIDDEVHCVYGDNSPEPIRACILTPQKESSSGGPFFRDINSNNAGTATNLYNYMNSGHVQTEKWRMGLHGPYYLQFSRSGIPTSKGQDFSWFGELGLKGYVPNSERGFVKGTATGVDSQFQRVVHWYNDVAQYWTYASSNGAFTSPAMKTGSYTMVLYQNEYKVATTTVTVNRGQTTTRDIASSLVRHNTIWQIGALDSQPFGFKNADKFLRMHPSDSRMASWGPSMYTVGQSNPGDFPMALFKSVNAPQTIRFNLNSDPGAATLRIATTLSFAGARPQATVNGWKGPIPAAPPKIDSRGVTRGAYRGNGEVYDVNIPAGTLKVGSNIIEIHPVSGSSGTTFLSPNIIMDSVELFTG